MKLIQAIKKYQFLIQLVIALRVGYSLWLALIWLVVDKWFPVNSQTLWENYYHLSRGSTLISRSFVDVWLRWDAVHYMNIAAYGYQGVGPADTVFFPLYPYLVGGLSNITRINVILMGMFVSSLATLFALICLYNLVLVLFNDPKLAKWSIVLLAFYPTAFFLHAPFTDALFLLCTIASILMMVEKKHITAGLFACAAGLTRPQGVLLMIPMIVFFIQAHWNDKKFFQWREILALLIAPLGFIAYSIWRVSIGLPDMFQSLLQYSSVRFQDPLSTLIKAAIRINQRPTIIEVTELFSVLFFLAILVWMFTRVEFRPHLAILLYSAATWLLYTSKMGFGGSPLQSSNRYVIHIFFAYVGLAMILQGFSDKTRKSFLMISLLLGLASTTVYALWYFVG